jgi:hypothetical protein
VFSQITTGSAICVVARTNPKIEGRLFFKGIQGSRSSKFDWLGKASILDGDWTELTTSLGSPITDTKSTAWLSHISLGDLMPFQANGIHQQRTWVNDPSKSILKERWQKLANARVANRGELMKETRSKKVAFGGKDLESGNALGPINERINSDPASIVRYSFRTLDRQWLLADSRVIDMPSPTLWAVRGKRQIFFNELHSHPIGTGPAISIAGFIPNLDHFRGHSGGRVLPVFRDKENIEWNLLPGLVELLQERISEAITHELLIEYIAGLTSFPAFSKFFQDDLREGGVRVPITLDYDLFLSVASLGADAIELFTYGERTLSPGRPKLTLRIGDGPFVVGSKDSMRQGPENPSYLADRKEINLGEIVIGEVPESVWSYEVSGMPVVKKWLGYRKASPSAKWSSPLNDIVTENWPKSWTEELLDLLHVILQLRNRETIHADLLAQVIKSKTFDVTEVEGAGLLPPPIASTKPASSLGGLSD